MNAELAHREAEWLQARLNPDSDLGAVPDTVTEFDKILDAREELVAVAANRMGIVEHFPSNDPSDWFVADLGNMMTAPSNEVLQSTLEQRLQKDSSLKELCSKVGIHRCSAFYCCKPRPAAPPREADDGSAGEDTTANDLPPSEQPTIPAGEQTPLRTECRFDYPRALLFYTQVFTEEGDCLLRVERSQFSASGRMYVVRDPASKYNGKVVMRMSRNHFRSTQLNHDLLLAWGGNIDLQFIFDPKGAMSYLLKYIGKGETNGAQFNDFVKQAFEGTGDTNLRQFCQRIIMRSAKGHDMSLPEAALHLNKGELMVFSRKMLYFNTLEVNPINFGEQSILKKSRGECFDERKQDPNFLKLQQAYEEYEVKPTPMHPADITLYEFLTMFDAQWIPLDKFVVVVPIPSFERRPNSETNPEWFSKFAFSLLRLHAVRNTVTLDELDLFTIEELVEMGNHEFTKPDTHAWIRDMWAGNVPDYQALNQLNNLGAEPEEGPEQPEGDNNEFAALLQPEVDAEALPDVDVAAEETPDFPYFEDRERFCPAWNYGTAGVFRDMVRSTEMEADEQDVLDFTSLNTKQQAVVTFVLDQFDRQEQFLLEVCGSAGNGKTTIMRRIREDIKIRIAGSPYHHYNAYL